MKTITKNKSLLDIRNNKFRSVLCGIAVFAIFFFLYICLSKALSKTGVFKVGGVLFEFDIPRVIKDMTKFSGKHGRTSVHPLYVLLMNPIGELIELVIGHDIKAAVFLNSFLGALGVTLGYTFFLSLRKRIIDAVLLAFLFGISTSHLILSIVPETASLAICSLIVTYILLAKSIIKERTNLLLWILAGVFSLGITSTNLLQTAICFGICTIKFSERNHWFVWGRKMLVFFIGVLSITAFFAVIQKSIYPRSIPFYLPEVYMNEMQYASLLVFQKPLTVFAQLFKHFFWVNFIGPSPAIFTMVGKNLPAITFSSSLDFNFFGIIGSIFWFVLLGTNIIQMRKVNQNLKGDTQDGIQPFLGLILCLLFNLVFHSFYGVGERNKIEYFVYSGNFTFLVLVISTFFHRFESKYMRAFLLFIIISAGINNILVIKEIIDIYL